MVVVSDESGWSGSSMVVVVAVVTVVSVEIVVEKSTLAVGKNIFRTKGCFLWQPF